MKITQQRKSSRFYGVAFARFNGEPSVSDPMGGTHGISCQIGLPFFIVRLEWLRGR